MKRILFFFLCVISFSVFSNTLELRQLSSRHTKNAIDVMLTFSRLPAYHAFMISNPDRFVMDFEAIKMGGHLRLALPNNNVLSDIRYATHPDGTLRIVFVLTHFANPNVITLRQSSTGLARLVVAFPDAVSSSAPVALLPPEKTENNNSASTVSSLSNVSAPLPAQPVLTDQQAESSGGQNRKVIVVIDPGHGGKDPGAQGIGGTKEKNIVLSISKILQQKINAMPGFQAVLTRSTDRYLTLRERLRVARQDHADMFVAIHADKWRNADARGVSVFALSQRGATSEAARWLAKRENASELMGGVQLNDQSHLLQSVLINLSQSATIRTSLIIGKMIMQDVKPFARLHHQKVEQAAFVVLKSPDIPSLLVETGFLSNPSEENKLRSIGYQTKLADAISDGIQQYFDENPPRGTQLSYWKRHHHVE